ncbi:tetratricopeptide repeat protein [Streptomyces sp. NPDC012751]|uniref:tetratricopeptide repeat protein n=1 Tax=Streptomyces sp. NPDC012751 TaxID=3364846 RepID=UPI0036B3F543
MRTVHFEAQRKRPTHSLLKALIIEAGFNATEVRERLAMRFLYPLSNQYSIPPAEISMSDGADFAHQIRFFLIERSRRHVRFLSDRILKSLGPTTVHIYNSAALDTGSRDFVSTLSRSGIAMNFLLHSEEAPTGTQLITHVPTPEELTAQRHARKKGKLTHSEFTELRSAAERYLNVGDAWTVIPLCERLLEEASDPELHRIMGIALLLVGKTLEAEAHYLRWRTGGETQSVKANYALAMLYARHHPKHLINLDQSERYLEEAFNILQDASPDYPNLTFDQVFNRNGLALLEYKRGMIERAAQRVQNGIDRLLNETTPQESLHRVVLIYNVALCYQTLGRLAEAKETFNELIEHDPKMPDYHLELARVHLSLDDHAAALSRINIALSLDGSIAEAHSLRGYALAQMGNIEEGLTSLREAFRLDQAFPSYAYDLAYALNEAQQHHEAQEILKTHLKHVDISEVSADMWSLQAEISSHTGGLNEARTILLEALEYFPADENIVANVGIIESAIDQDKAPHA